jgi:hypothetical protein
VITPLIIFKAKNLSQAWIPASIHEIWAFSYNAKGWTTNQYGLEWLHRCFDPTIHQKANANYQLLICDGYDSHITEAWIGYCMNNNIILMILLPHSSHRTQPLDVVVFSLLKRYMVSQLESLLQMQLAWLNKAEWIGTYVDAHDDAFTEKNIKAGFHTTGIHPFLPSKLLHQSSSITPRTNRNFITNPNPAHSLSRWCSYKLPSWCLRNKCREYCTRQYDSIRTTNFYSWEEIF